MSIKTRWQAAYDQQAPPDQLAGGVLQFNGYRNRRLYTMLQTSLARATAQWVGWEVLDAGCGSGDTNSFLKEKNQVVGADFSLQMARHARRHYPQVSLADVEQMPFPAQQFDGVIATGVWQCLPSDTPFLGEVARILKPQGEAVFGWVLNRDFLLYRRGVKFRLDPTVSINLLGAEQIHRLLAGAGLKVVAIYAAVLPWGVVEWGHRVAPMRWVIPAYTVRCVKMEG